MDIHPSSLSTVKDCETLLANHRSAGIDQQDPLVIQLKRTRNALLPIARLPRELRHRILQFVLPHRRLGGPDFQFTSVQPPIRPALGYYLALFTIRKVSRLWDQDICGTPSFWTVMSPLFSDKLRELVWQRSCHMALDAEVVRKGHPYSFFESQPWTEGEVAYLGKIIQRGIRDLHLQVPRGADPSPYITNTQHPRLATLYIHQDQSSFEITSPIHAPQLVDLHLVNCGLPLDGLTKLRSLSLYGTVCPTLTQLFQTLAASPFLEELELTALRELPSDQRVKEDVPQGPLDMQYLTRVELERIPCRITAGLLDRLVAPPHCRSSVDVDVQGYTNVPSLCQQAGRLCRWVGDASEGLLPNLNICQDVVSFTLGYGTLLSLQNHGWSDEEHETGFSQRSQLIRLFLDEIDRAGFKEPIDESYLWYDSISAAFEGTRIMEDFFPNICGLNITVDVVGLQGMIRALSETKNPQDGLPRWPLPKLSTLEIKIFGHDETYDNLIDLTIKRTLAAASPLSAVSPIRKLTLGHGRVQQKSLRKLDDMGIEYELRYVTFTNQTACEEYDEDDSE
ncbi:hypothetical protein FRC04_006311 [Tulasnella sp. 424]|nr:hypothetical protein FRC04_006311 [Tulasnella sp. 424]